MLRYLIILIIFSFVRTGFSQCGNSCPSMLYYQAIELLQKEDTVAAQKKFIELFDQHHFGDLTLIYNLYVSKSIKSTELNELLNVIAIQKGCDIDFFNSLLNESNFDTISINSIKYSSNRNIYLSRLDSFLIKEIMWLRDRDQAVRTKFENTNEHFRKTKYIDSTNIAMLLSLIKYNKGKFPSFDQLGDEGYDALTTILHHFDIENINDIFPYLIAAIKEHSFFDSETILYQVDRNVIGSQVCYLYNPDIKKFDIGQINPLLHNQLGYFQYYGGMDMFDYATRKRYFWPTNPNRNLNIVSALLCDLCLPIDNPLKSHILEIDPESFVLIGLKYR